jgi:hypothetical protein
MISAILLFCFKKQLVRLPAFFKVGQENIPIVVKVSFATSKRVMPPNEPFRYQKYLIGSNNAISFTKESFPLPAFLNLQFGPASGIKRLGALLQPRTRTLFS